MTNKPLYPWSIESVRRGGLPAIALFTFHVIASRGFHAYEKFPPLDIPMHFFGGVVIAYFFHHASIAASSYGIIGSVHHVTHTVLVFSLTCAATVFWEFAEFIVDHFFGTHAQLGLDDTMGDMLLGICGGSIFLAVAFFAFEPKNQTTQEPNPTPEPTALSGRGSS